MTTPGHRPAPSTGSYPRPLTSSERLYLLSRNRGARWGALFGGILLLGTAAAIWREVIKRASQLGSSPLDLRIFFFGFPAIITIGALSLFVLALRRPPYGRRGKAWPRAGPHRGVFRYGGKPVQFWVGDVLVNVPLEWLPHLPLGRAVDVELTPSFADVPATRRVPRTVLSAHGGRLSVDAQVRDGTLRVRGYPDDQLADPPVATSGPA